MRIGIDVDGVLADYLSGFHNVLKDVTGVDKAPNPLRFPSWNWPKAWGYTDEEIAKALNFVQESPHFWMNLKSLKGVNALNQALPSMDKDEIYFITDRYGYLPKTQTEIWLVEHGMDRPTVLLSGQKGLIAKALKLDVFVDDKPENCSDVQHWSPTTRTYMLAMDYNEHVEDEYDTYNNLEDVFKVEGIMEYSYN